MGELEEEQRDFYISNGLIVELGGIASLAAFRKLGADKSRHISDAPHLAHL